jgi:hypothetical protein
MQQICQNLDATKEMKKPVNVSKRFPFCLVVVSVAPRVCPFFDQFVQKPICTVLLSMARPRALCV